MSGGAGAIQGIMAIAKYAMGDSKKRKGEEQKRLAEGYKPPLEDPEMRSYLGYLQRKRRSIESGSAYNGAYDRIQQNLSNTQTGISQVSGGAAGAAITGMQRASLGANASFGDIVAQQSGDLLNWDNKYGVILDKIAKRKEEYQLLKYNQETAEAASKIKAGEEESNAAISDGLGILGSMGSKSGSA